MPLLRPAVTSESKGDLGVDSDGQGRQERISSGEGSLTNNRKGRLRVGLP